MIEIRKSIGSERGSALTSLLVSLRSYRPREGRDSLENFVTEVFRWLLDSNPSFAEHFIVFVRDQLQEEKVFNLPQDPVVWHSQFPLGPKRPDMVAEWQNALLIFEHKVWSRSLVSQLGNYRKLAHEHYPNRHSIVILIVPHAAEFKTEADLCLCWSDVYGVVEAFLKQQSSSELEKTFLRDFLALLDHEGIGIPAPVSAIALRYFNEAFRLPRQLQRLYSQLSHDNWIRNFPGYRMVEDGSRWGRIGLYWSRTEAKHKWSPGIALCTVVDGGDHGINHRMKQNDTLKLQVIISFNRFLRSSYCFLNEYEQLKLSLQKLSVTHEWDLYDHVNDPEAKRKNHCHALYLEVALPEVLRGAKNLVEQVAAVKYKAQPLMDDLLGLKELKSLQQRLDLI